jgi:ribosomal protein L16/L10AE
LSSVLDDAGIDPAHGQEWEAKVEAGAVLLGVHARADQADAARAALIEAGATDLETATGTE